MQKHYKLRLITNILDREDIWCLSIHSALNMVRRSRKDSVLWVQSDTMGESQSHIIKPSQMRHTCQLASCWLTYRRLDLLKR